MTSDSYELLRTLTSPVVAVTSRRGEKKNGMISDAALRASIVPEVPRAAVFIHKFNYSHEMIFESGRFALHILHKGQLDLGHRLGFFSGRDRDKLADVAHRIGVTGCPVLEDCYAWFECQVANVMDTGSSTLFLGDVVALGRGPGREILQPAYLRANLPEALVAEYLANLQRAQETARTMSRDIRPVVWRGLSHQA
jgi:flavin reductase (DIM6/NTAB) family NADH-FMN oxidoreductase RutF